MILWNNTFKWFLRAIEDYLKELFRIYIPDNAEELLRTIQNDHLKWLIEMIPGNSWELLWIIIPNDYSEQFFPRIILKNNPE